MLTETLQFLVRTLAELFVLVLLLRFYLQVARASFRHPLAQFCIALTNFLVVPARRLIRSIHGYDTATLALAWLVSLIANVLMLTLNPLPYDFTAGATWAGLSLLSLLDVFRLSLYLIMGAVLVQAVLSWVNPYNPLAPVLDALTRPLLQPFRRAVVGGVDLSPLILILLIQVILMLPVRMLEASFLTQIKYALS